MTPLWKRQLRRPQWKRDYERSQGIIVRLSDFNLLAPMHAAANRIRERQDRMSDRMGALLDRLDERDRQRAERERAERAARLVRHR